MMTTETRVLPNGASSLRAVEAEDGARRLFGYGAVFDSLSQDLGGFKERISPAAFSRTMAIDGNDFLVTMNHDVNLLLGRTGARTARVGTDQTGVWYEVDLPDTQAGRDVWTLAARRDLAGSSFTFTVPKGGDQWSRDDEGRRIRELTEVRLIELGPVASPAYLDTTVAARSFAAAFPPDDDEEEAETRDGEEEISDIEGVEGVDEEPRVQPTLSVARRVLRTVR